VTRNDTLNGALALNSPLSGPGQLTLTWTDSYGRTVAVESRKVTLKGSSVPIRLRLKPAVALLNSLSVQLTSSQGTVKAGPTDFVVTPNEPWDDYQVIMYYAYKPEQQPALRQLGVTAGQIQNVASRKPDGAARWWKNNFRFYCDQMAYDFFAPYHSPAIPGKERLMREGQGTLQGRPHPKGRFLPQALLPRPRSRSAGDGEDQTSCERADALQALLPFHRRNGSSQLD
jgi:hypothetical protein